MTITLPDEMRAGLEVRAKAEGYGSVDELVEVALLADEAFAGSPKSSAQTRLAELMDDGLASGPAVPVTPELWERLHVCVD